MKDKKIGLSLMSFLLIFSMCSCGGKTTETSVESSAQNVGETYKIVFNTNGGTPVSEISGVGGSVINAPGNPTKTGYEFDGWFIDSEFTKAFTFDKMPDSNIELFAKWSLKTYTITYYVDGGTNNPNNPDTYNILKKDIKLQDATKDGWYFAGWYLDRTFTLKITSIKTNSATDYNLYAKWSEGEPVMNYNINYHLDGGTNSENNPATFNSSVQSFSLENATRDGYYFAGWYTDDTYITAISLINTSLEQDIDVYAKWESKASTYLVNYKLDGGTNGNNPVRYKDTDKSFKLEPALRPSSVFMGWFLDPEFSEPITEIDTSKKQNYTVYAKFLAGVNEIVHTLDLGIGSEHVIYHISDAHVVPGVSSSDKEREKVVMSSYRLDYANSWNETFDEKYLPQSSKDGFQNIINYCESQSPDALALSGDIIDSASDTSKQWLKTTLGNIKTPFVYALGNHEVPHSTFPVMSGMDSVDFTVLDCGDFEIVAMDNGESVNNKFHFTSTQYTKLRLEIEKNKPIIIVQHLPILTSYNTNSAIRGRGDYYFIDYTDPNLDSTTKNVISLMLESSCVKLVLCGHIHGNTRTDLSASLPQISSGSALMGHVNKIIIK